jgi:ATP/maltotriose-dependent transcriptional regulator MalT
VPRARMPRLPGDEVVSSAPDQEVFDALTGLDAVRTLTADELEALGDAAWWLRRLPECVGARERAVAAHLAAGDPGRAAGVALQLFYTCFVRGERAIATGWLRRAIRLLEHEPEGAVHGHVRVAQARVARAQGDVEGELAHARAAVELGQRYGDADLVALGQYIEGRLLVRQGKVADGMATLDEAMLAATQGELGPMTTGQVYCNVIAACQELGDLRRAGEWTEALRGWSSSQPASVFPGLCRVHRAEVMHFRGAWADAEAEARAACTDLLDSMPGFAGEAFYEIGEVRRRRGDLAEAEAAFQRASELGREPQPGLALVRLEQGRHDVSATALRRVLAEEPNRLVRARLLAAQVKVALAGGELETAGTAADELGRIARDYGSEALEASAISSRGAVEFATGDIDAALRSLRRAWELWQVADCPFEAAEARRLLGLASRRIGDEEGADLAIGWARDVFERLGASTESARTTELLGAPAQPAADPRGAPLPAGLTAREVEVLCLVAAGKSNREIAAELYLSAKTVARHLSNIFCKLDVSSRTAAAAFAFEHGLTGAS